MVVMTVVHDVMVVVTISYFAMVAMTVGQDVTMVIAVGHNGMAVYSWTPNVMLAVTVTHKVLVTMVHVMRDAIDGHMQWRLWRFDTT